MLEVLFFLLPISYFSILLTLIHLTSKKDEKLIPSAPNCLQSSSQTTNNDKTDRKMDITNLDNSTVQVPKPSYKRADLIIEIPDTPSFRKIRRDEVDHDSLFIREYILTNCFPLLLFNERSTGLTRIQKFTIWYTVYCIECFIVIMAYSSGFYQATLNLEYIGVSVITIFCCCPLSSVFTLILVRYTDHIVFKIINWAAMGVFMGLILAMPGLGYLFVEEEFEIHVIKCCCIVLGWEIVVLEIIRTSIKTACYMHSRDFNCCFSLAQKI